MSPQQSRSSLGASKAQPRPVSRSNVQIVPSAAVPDRVLTPEAPAPVPRPAGLMGLIRLWMWRVRSRAELAELDTERLRDAGIHPRLARREADKPFWRA